MKIEVKYHEKPIVVDAVNYVVYGNIIISCNDFTYVFPILSLGMPIQRRVSFAIDAMYRCLYDKTGEINNV